LSTLNLDLNIIPCFLAVAEHGSISGASSSLHLSQPAISLQIKKLEGEIGGPLFDRHNRGLVLTPLGTKILPQARALIQVAEDIMRQSDDFYSEPSGKIKVGTYTTASSYLLPPALKGFLKKFPKTGVTYRYDPTEDLLEMIKRFEIDCAVLSEVPTNDPLLNVEPFFKDELIFVTAKANYKGTKKITPKDLEGFDYLSYPLRFDLCYRLVEQNYGKYLKKARIPVETVSFDTLKQSLLEGIGATFMPSYLIKKELENKRLTPISVGNKRLPITFSFVSKKDAPMSKATSEFRSSILSYFSSL